MKLIKKTIHLKTDLQTLGSIYFLLAVLIRLIWLDHVPGINGDEAWYGVMVAQPINLQIRTPTGNLLNVFYLIPLFFTQKLFEPHLWILRSISTLSGITLIGSGYFLLRRSWGTRSAYLFLILSTSMPILVAYSRFGWDASQTGLASLFLIYFSLKKKWKSAMMMQVLSMIVHPTNIFLIFIPSVLFLLNLSDNAQARIKKFLVMLILGVLLALSSFYLVNTIDWFTTHSDIMVVENLLETKSIEILGRLTSVSGWKNLFVLYGDLISGATIYKYIVGPISNLTKTFHFIFFWIFILPIILYGCWMEIRRQQLQATGIFLGGGLGLVTLYLLVGTYPLSPNYERYSQFLVVPTIFLLIRGLDMFSSIKAPYIIAIFISVFWIVSVILNYFVPLRLTGSVSHRTFRTASIEPKEQVANFILEQTQESTRNIVVLAEDWWLTMPVKYLLSNHKNISVIQWDTNNAMRFTNILNQGGFVIAFSLSDLDKLVEENSAICTCEKETIFDYSNSPIINIWYQPSR